MDIPFKLKDPIKITYTYSIRFEVSKISENFYCLFLAYVFFAAVGLLPAYSVFSKALYYF